MQTTQSGYGDAETWPRGTRRADRDDDGLDAAEYLAWRVREAMRDPDFVAEVSSDLYCLDEADMNLAVLKAAWGQPEMLRLMIWERAEIMARRQIDDEAEAARKELEAMRDEWRGEP